MPQLTKEQVEMRRHVIGASDVAAICGVNPWRSPLAVWLEKVSEGELGEQEATAAQQRGHELEGYIAAAFERRMHMVSIPWPTIVHSERRWAAATIDRMLYVGEATEPAAILEIKTVGASREADWEDGIPNYVRLQVLWQMDVSGIHEAYVAVLFGGEVEPRIYPCHWDEELVEQTVDLASHFWHEYVLKKREPPVDGSGAWRQYLAERYPDEVELLLMDADEECESLAQELAAIRQTQTQIEERRGALENKLKARMGNAAGMIGSTFRISWKLRSGQPQWKAIAETFSPSEELIREYTSKPVRVFRFTPGKETLR